MTNPPPAPSPLPSELELVRGALAPEYEVIAEIGRGGMAIVYRAVERELGRQVALKVLPPTFASDGTVVERFLDEARTAAALEHPHIIPIHRVGRSGGLPFIAMRLVPGPSLGEHLHVRGRLPAAEVRRMMIEVARALGYAHAHGVVHRDVKPDNVLLEPDGRCVVTDFGIAKLQRATRLTATGTAVGTPRYMSPEQARAQPIDGRSDLYALGVVAYECITGRTPFEQEDPFAVMLAHVQDPPPRPLLDDPEARRLWPVIERLLAKEPARRYASADALLEALGAPVAAHTANTLPAARPAAGDAPTLVTPLPGRTGMVRLSATWRALPRGGKAAVAGGFVTMALLIGAGAVWRARAAAGPASMCVPGRAPAVQVATVPRLQPGTPLPLRYELCGFPIGTPLLTTVTLRATAGATGRAAVPLRSSFEDAARSTSDIRQRRVTLPTLLPGNYEIRVTVRDRRGRDRTAAAPVRIAW